MCQETDSYESGEQRLRICVYLYGMFITTRTLLAKLAVNILEMLVEFDNPL